MNDIDSHDLRRLAAAFANTAYWVECGDEPFALRIGQRSAPLERCLQATGTTEWAYLTAYNPRAALAADDDNLRRHERLQAAIVARNWRSLPGRAVADEGNWPDEPSFLVLGAPREAAAALAFEFEQRAFLAGRTGEPVSIVWVD